MADNHTVVFYSKSTKMRDVHGVQISGETETHVELGYKKIPKIVIGSKKPYHGYYYFYSHKELHDFLNPNADFETEYMLLDRLRSDCDYYLGYGNRNTEKLWAKNVKDQIAKMRELYAKLPEKPEWLTEADIDNYESDMLEGNGDVG